MELLLLGESDQESVHCLLPLLETSHLLKPDLCKRGEIRVGEIFEELLTLLCRVLRLADYEAAQALACLANFARKLQPKASSLFLRAIVKVVKLDFFAVGCFIRELLNRPLRKSVVIEVAENFEEFETWLLRNSLSDLVH